MGGVSMANAAGYVTSTDIASQYIHHAIHTIWLSGNCAIHILKSGNYFLQTNKKSSVFAEQKFQRLLNWCLNASNSCFVQLTGQKNPVLKFLRNCKLAETTNVWNSDTQSNKHRQILPQLKKVRKRKRWLILVWDWYGQGSPQIQKLLSVQGQDWINSAVRLINIHELKYYHEPCCQLLKSYFTIKNTIILFYSSRN